MARNWCWTFDGRPTRERTRIYTNLTNPRDLIVVTAAAVLRAVQGEAELQGMVPKTSPPFPVQTE